MRNDNLRVIVIGASEEARQRIRDYTDAIDRGEELPFILVDVLTPDMVIGKPFNLVPPDIITLTEPDLTQHSPIYSPRRKKRKGYQK